MKNIKIVLFALVFSMLAGCAATPQVVGTINPHSKFAKLKMGMGQSEVAGIVGTYTDSKYYTNALMSYVNNPIQQMRGNGHFAEFYYKGQGILTFEGLDNLKLVKIVADSTETGYKK